jgi:hypothetical protein
MLLHWKEKKRHTNKINKNFILVYGLT